jgi:hypothetical protein
MPMPTFAGGYHFVNGVLERITHEGSELPLHQAVVA